ncbi:MAG: aldehyde dehydrogenase family protein [Planctomycetes bacterium]|nr:aldehyde dehydrogenase family protein [Planctomycetota bacterium]
MGLAATAAPRKLFIGGQWVEPATGRSFSVVNPATEEAIVEVAEGGAQDVDAAVQAARKAFDEGKWASLGPGERARLMGKAADLLESKLDEFVHLETANCGKTLAESRIELTLAAEVLRYFAGWATKHSGETIPSRPQALLYTMREPVGVVGAITPWNFPLLLAMWKVAPALATGNTIVHKPATLTPLTALKFAEVVQAAGFPEGVFNVVPGPGATVGEAILAHPGVDKVAFTGDSATGKRVMRACADTLKKVSLELGGKSPNIVFADADLDAAARGALNAIFYNKGEVCAAGSRLFVEEAVKEDLLGRLVDRAKKTVVGDPLDKGTRMGPVISKTQLEKVLSYVEAGKKEGARLSTGGDRPSHLSKGYFMNPTIFADVKNSMKIAREEIFGPVLSVLSFKDVGDAVAQANDTMYGLAAAVWTKDVKKAHRVARAIKAGTVWVNAYNLYDAALPFGGTKQSGFGRELGRDALDPYTQTKSVWIDLS